MRRVYNNSNSKQNTFAENMMFGTRTVTNVDSINWKFFGISIKGNFIFRPIYLFLQSYYYNIVWDLRFRVQAKGYVVHVY